MSDPSIANGADSIAVAQVPISRFSNNIGYASGTGLLIRYHRENATDGVYGVLDNNTFWNNSEGIRMEYSQNLLFKNDRVISAEATPEFVAVTQNQIVGNITYENMTVTGYHYGIWLPGWGYNVIDGGTFDNDS